MPIMRRIASSWSNTLSKLGFRRVRTKPLRRATSQHRRFFVEGLEERHMLSITVNTLTDENDTYSDGGPSNSLREALAYAATQGGNDLIEFDSKLTGGVIQLTNGQLIIDSSVTIAGLGADELTIKADINSRAIFVNGSVTATISNLTITGGKSADGAGVYTNGILTLDSVLIAGNAATDRGGGIFVSDLGSATVIDSTINNNQAYYGAGIYGYLQGSQKLKVRNSTISNNQGVGEWSIGGGVMIQTPASGSAEFLNTTVSHNVASFSGGIRLFNGTHIDAVNSTIAYNKGNESGGLQLSFATGTINNTIIAENTNAAGTTALDVLGFLDVNNSHNSMIGRGGASGFTTTVDARQNFVLASDQTAGLAPLSDYGGPTQTHALLSTSRAIDAGSNLRAVDKGLIFDQRGFGRIVDDGEPIGPAGGIVDIGAFELGQRITVSADFDGNGRTDFATFDPLTDTIVAFLGANQGIDQISVGQLDSTKQWERFLVGDFNGDGRDDLWIKEVGVDRWSIAVSDGSRFNVSAASAAVVSSSFATPYLGDFDGDGSTEVLGWHSANRWDVLKYDDRHGASLQTTWGADLGFSMSPRRAGAPSS
jgi:hypothetical protein